MDCGPDSSGLGDGLVADTCQRGSEPSDSMNCWEILCVTEQIITSQKESAPQSSKYLYSQWRPQY